MNAICLSCRKSFDSAPVHFEGREIFWPRYCPQCCEEITAKRAQEVQNERLDLHQRGRGEIWESVCPPLYRDTDPSRLPELPLKRVLSWPFGSRGLLLHGATGAGKTRAAYLLLHRLIFEDGKKVVAFQGNSFAHQCARKFGEQQCGEEWIEELTGADVVFFDDLGKSRFTERVEAEQFGLIEARMAHLRPVIITTNFVGDSLTDKLTGDRGAPLVRRLREFCECVAFP